MSSHLLLVTLGPVQDFIAQARRTRDLWYGSHLLSELSRAAARALVKGGALLVFPALERNDPELDPCPKPLRPNDSPPLAIANKLLAEVPEGVDPAHLARTVRHEIQRFWKEDVAAPVKQGCRGLLAHDIDAAWDEQIETFLEFAATWAPAGAGYESARTAGEQAIAGRKNLRDFTPWKHVRQAVPKSSLDGGRETVLARRKARDARLALRYRIADAEQLDAVGLVKRAGGKPDQFVPVVNVALGSWVARATAEAGAEIEALRKACLAAGLSRVQRPDLPVAKDFPFDASILLPSRWKAVFEEQGLTGEAEAWGRENVGPLHRQLGEPYPYVACLAADGDRMGRAIERLGLLGGAGAHRKLSRALARFASDARRLVEQEHRGSLVYAGGDDVLGFLPVPETLACTDALRDAFARALAEACDPLPESERPTLSAGIGIGHVMESMGELLALGREAERLAKQGRDGEPDRNALAVVVDKRSGGRSTWRARWDVWEGGPANRLRADADLLAERLPSRKLYEIARTLRRMPEAADGAPASWSRALAREVRRSLGRIHGGADTPSPEDLGLDLDADAAYARVHGHVRRWVERMLVARTLAMAVPGRGTTVEVNP